MTEGKKTRLGIIFGGKSGEHEVSLLSAASVIGAVNKEKYELVYLGITKAGEWKIFDGSFSSIASSASMDSSAAFGSICIIMPPAAAIV